MLYECKLCEFSAKSKRDRERHLKTKKHLAREKEYDDNMKIHGKINCPHCKCNYNTPASLNRHMKTCISSIISQIKNNHEFEIQKKDMEIIFQQKEIENLQKIIEIKDSSNKKTEDLTKKTIDILDTENAYHKDLVDRTGKLVKTSMSALQFAKKYYPDAPVLVKYDNMAAIKLDKEYGVGATMIWHDENNTIAEAIGGIILKEYKKEDPRYQSFWNSDFARVAYIIMDSVNNKKQWIVDKGGVRVQELLVDPILGNIRMKLIKRSVRKAKNLAEDYHNPEKYIHQMNQCNILIKKIDTNVIAGKVMRYLSKFLNIKNQMTAIEDVKKPTKQNKIGSKNKLDVIN